MSNDKVRLMIEVSEDTINECKVLFGQGYANNAEYAISQGTPITDGDVEKAVEILRNYHNGYFGYKIDDVKKAHNLAIVALSSLNSSGDCISRKDLKLAIREMPDWCGDDAYYSGVNDVSRLIDNAQAIPLPNEQIAWEQGFEAGLAQGKQDNKGEWIDHSEDYGYTECPFCHELTNCEGNIEELHYCWNCGAELRKGGKEE